MIRLDAATVLLQWAVGGLFFLWITTRRRDVGVGYGWLLRGVWLVVAAGSVAAGRLVGSSANHSAGWAAVRDGCGALVVAGTGVALVVSILRRRAGVVGERARQARREARVAAMIDRAPVAVDTTGAEFPPWLDLVAPTVGAVGVVAAALADGGPHLLAVVRTVAGTAFLGVVSDAMLLGHWYLVQPGLGRAPLNDLVRWATAVWPIEVATLLWPTGMPAVLSGRINDGYGGILGWFWVACAATTLGLFLVTRAALKERAYSAVMAATGLLYLAILTAFGTDLVARAVLAA
jgi:hypothetical protein